MRVTRVSSNRLLGRGPRVGHFTCPRRPSYASGHWPQVRCAPPFLPIDLPDETFDVRADDEDEGEEPGESEFERDYEDRLYLEGGERMMVVDYEVADGRYRADLLARLGQTVRLPSLQERQEDIIALVEHFSAMHNRGPIKKQFADETLEVLQGYRWEFNVRQLAQVVQTVMCLSDNDVILPSDLPDYIREHSPVHAS